MYAFYGSLDKAIQPPITLQTYLSGGFSMALDITRVSAVAWDIESHTFTVAFPSPYIGLTIILALGLGGVAAARREIVAASLLLGPSAFYLLEVLHGGRWFIFQLGGMLFPLVLSGAVMTLEGELERVNRRGFLIGVFGFCVILLIGMRIPRLISALNRYTISPPATQIYQETEIDELARKVDKGPVMIAHADVLPLLVALVELGRRGVALQFSKAAWERAFAYRDWPYVRPLQPAALTLVPAALPVPAGAEQLFINRQYRLILTPNPQ
jgi:hypothetical protein